MTDITTNKRALFDYEILDTYEAGIALRGFEAKAVKAGRMNLTGSFALIRGGEAVLVNATIPPHQPKNAPADYDPARSRRLLLKKAEIRELIGKTSAAGLALVPLGVYTKRNLIKIRLGLARHKKKADKRETIRRREAEREMRRATKRPQE